MADEKILFELDLDTGEFKRKLEGATGDLDKLKKKGSDGGNSINESWEKMIGTFTRLAAEFIIVKELFELIISSEKINQLNKQFQILADSAGVSGDRLKSSFVEASEGVISTSEAVELLNKSFVKLGDNIERAPEILELSRKVASLFGRDVKEVYDDLSTAIQNGNMRQLKSVGIWFDQEKALRTYASTLGVSVKSLTEVDRKQALFNASLEAGAKKFKDIKTDLDPVEESFSKFKASISNVVDAIKVMVSNSSPLFASFFETLTTGLKSVSKNIVATFGTGPESIAAGIDITKGKIEEIKTKIAELEQEKESPGIMTRIFGRNYTAIFADYNNQLGTLKQELEILEAQKAGFDAQKGGGGTGSGADAAAAAEQQKNAEERARNQVLIESKTQQQILQLKLQANQQDQQMAQSTAQSDAALNEQKLLLESQFYAQVRELQANKDIEDTTRNEMILQMYQNHINQKSAIDQNYDDARKRALDNNVAQSQNAAQGFARSFESASHKAGEDMKKGLTLGSVAVSSFQARSTAAFEAIGDGSQSAGEAMKGFFFGAIGDMASAQGQIMLLSAIWPPNPVAAAAGAALMILGGFLKGQAKSAGSDVPAASGGGGGAGFAPMSVADSPTLDEKKLQKTVTINVAGSYFDTDQTRTRVTELIRDSADFTDFKFNTIGLQGV